MKIDTIEIKVGDQIEKVHFNVNKEGVFSMTINHNVAELLGLEPRRTTSRELASLKKIVQDAHRAFIESSKKETVWIGIHYGAQRSFLPPGVRDRKFEVGSFVKGSALRFDFEIYLKTEYASGSEQWSKAVQGKNKHRWPGDPEPEPEKWYKDGHAHNRHEAVLIPYSEDAVKTLQKAKDGIKEISRILYEVISQEPEKIVSALSSGNLLTERSQS